MSDITEGYMLKRFGIFLFCGVITVAGVKMTFAQNSADNTVQPAAATTDAAKPAATATTPDAAAKPADAATTSVADKPAEKPAEQPVAVVAGSNAEKAKQYFDGAVTYVNSKTTFRLASRDNFLADKVLYKIDGGAETVYDKEFTIAAEGKHTITYYGVDKIGNKEDDKSFTVYVDNTAPELTVNPKFPIYAANGKLYISKQFTFNIAAVDALSGVNKVTYTLNGKDFIDYATAFSIYTDGDITFSANAFDNVGNKTTNFKIKLRDDTGKESVESKDTLQLFVDNIAPTVTITADKQITPAAGKNVVSKDYKYTVAAADKESGVKMVLVRVDGKGDFTPYDKELFFTTNGDHYIEAKAIDAVGNISDTVILSVYVDVIPPKTAIETVAD